METPLPEVALAHLTPRSSHDFGHSSRACRSTGHAQTAKCATKPLTPVLQHLPEQRGRKLQMLHIQGYFFREVSYMWVQSPF
jgi:hypothetical protein